MPRPYPPEFRRRAIAFVDSGRTGAKTAIDLDIIQATIYVWIKQDRIDRGEIPGRTTEESQELRRARRPLRELEAEVEILRRARPMSRSPSQCPDIARCPLMRSLGSRPEPHSLFCSRKRATSRRRHANWVLPWSRVPSGRTRQVSTQRTRSKETA